VALVRPVQQQQPQPCTRQQHPLSTHPRSLSRSLHAQPAAVLLKGDCSGCHTFGARSGPAREKCHRRTTQQEEEASAKALDAVLCVDAVLEERSGDRQPCVRPRPPSAHRPAAHPPRLLQRTEHRGSHPCCAWGQLNAVCVPQWQRRACISHGAATGGRGHRWRDRTPCRRRACW
jgi:hypothetical protein